jgi:diguanylate cyclase (GGDEF)-like protein
VSQSRILIVDDEPANRTLLQRALRKSYEVEVAEDGEQGVNTARTFGPDLIIMDVMMPGIDGYEACAQLKADPDTAGIPVIFLSANDEVVRGFEVGGVDYVLKPMRISELLARIETHLELVRARRELEQRNRELIDIKRGLEDRVAERTAELSDTNERLREEVGIRSMAEERLAYLARHDPHTRLLNVQSFRTELDKHLLEAARGGHAHALIRIELANLEDVNARLGLAAGDDLVSSVANVVRENAPERSIVARVGGAKIAVSAPELDRSKTLRFAENVVRVATGDRFWVWDEAPHPVQVRAAVVVAEAGEQVSADLLLARVDRVSRATHSPVAVYDAGSERSDKVQLLARWAERIRHAVAEDRFVLFHQRIHPLQADEDGEHFEILLRLLDDEGALVPPGVFLPFVEELGFATMVDRWVVKSTMRWLSETKRQVACCSVNLSGQSLNTPAFSEELLDMMRDAPDLAKKLCFEVTETVAIVNIDELSAWISALRELGCRASLDDFGAGFASYGYLKQLPVDYLKIDGQFVKDIETDEVNRALVRSMKDVGHATGKQVIAEFVENQAIADRLREMGVDFAQGWGVHKPAKLE